MFDAVTAPRAPSLSLSSPNKQYMWRWREGGLVRRERAASTGPCLASYFCGWLWLSSAGATPGARGECAPYVLPKGSVSRGPYLPSPISDCLRATPGGLWSSLPAFLIQTATFSQHCVRCCTKTTQDKPRLFSPTLPASAPLLCTDCRAVAGPPGPVGAWEGVAATKPRWGWGAQGNKDAGNSGL